jgi:hypothetical protein
MDVRVSPPACCSWCCAVATDAQASEMRKQLSQLLRVDRRYAPSHPCCVGHGNVGFVCAFPATGSPISDFESINSLFQSNVNGIHVA